MTGSAHAQLLEMVVTPTTGSGTIPVFRDYPDDAALIISSSLTGLRFESNVGIVADQSAPNEGVYRIIVRPWRQTITVNMAGYRQARFTIPASQPRAVQYYNVEPVKSDAVALIPVNVRVNGHPDAVVFIDGQQVDLSRSIPMEAGTHTVRVEKLGFLTLEREITVTLARNFFEFDLQRVSQQRVVLRTNPAGARIRINGIERNETTPFDFFQFPGEYGLELSLPGYRTVATQMVISTGGNNDFEYSLSRIAGDLTINVTPANARVFVDEVEVTDTRILPLNPGIHVLRAQANGHDTYQTQFEMQEGTPLTLDVALKPHTGSARFTIRPIESRTVLYGPTGSVVQEWSGSNILEDLPVGRYRYVARLQGSPDHVGEVFITRNEEQDVSYNFGASAEIPANPVTPTASVSATKATLRLEADVDAEIYIGGQSYGRTRVAVPMDPGVYSVEFRHPLKTERIMVQVPASGEVSRQVSLRPAKAPAVMSSLLIPGSGLISTQRPRGFVYLAGFAGAAYYAWMQSGLYDDFLDKHDEFYSEYASAPTTTLAIQLRQDAEKARLDANKAAEQITIGLAAAAGIYVLQLLDVGVSSPPFGYKGQSRPAQFSLAPTGIRFTYSFN